jgi:hypothetical protein
MGNDVTAQAFKRKALLSDTVIGGLASTTCLCLKK